MEFPNYGLKHKKLIGLLQKFWNTVAQCPWFSNNCKDTVYFTEWPNLLPYGK